MPARATSQPFRAADHLRVYLLGFETTTESQLELENVATHQRLAIEPDSAPSVKWQPIELHLPPSWQGQMVRFVAAAQGAGTHSWIGFTEPLPVSSTFDLRGTALLVLRLIEVFVLLSLPFLACCVYVGGRWFGDPPLQLLAGVAFIGLAGYGFFWLWFYSARLGRLSSFFFPLVCAAYLLRTFPQLSARGRRALRALSYPWLLTFAASAFMLSAGFLYGGLDDPLRIARTRFSHELPIDDYLPLELAEQVRSGIIAKPMIGDWLSSDRPPLQTGFTLMQFAAVIRPRTAGYIVIAVVLQSLWLPALWAFLKALRLDGPIVYWILAACLFSALTFVNTFFVWPKLLSAAYMLAFCAMLAQPQAALARAGRARGAILAGTLLALAMLAHGGAAFAILGLFPFVLWIARHWRWQAMIILLVAAGCYFPWSLYQKFYDPPGDRLLKMHLAGLNDRDSRPLAQALHDEYAKRPWAAIFEARRQNLTMIADDQRAYWRDLFRFLGDLPGDLLRETKLAGDPAKQLRVGQFFHFFLSLGLYMIGPLFLLAGLSPRYRGWLWRGALLCWIFVAATLLVWSALMFRAGSTVVHQGSYVTPLLAMAGSLLAIWSVSPIAALCTIAFQSALNCILYLIYAKGIPLPGRLGQGVIHGSELILLALSLAFVLFLLRAGSRAEKTTAIPE